MKYEWIPSPILQALQQKLRRRWIKRVYRHYAERNPDNEARARKFTRLLIYLEDMRTEKLVEQLTQDLFGKGTK